MFTRGDGTPETRKIDQKDLSHGDGLGGPEWTISVAKVRVTQIKQESQQIHDWSFTLFIPANDVPIAEVI